MIALRLARAATGRDKIVIFDRAYNGHSDGTLAKTNRGPHGELISEPIAPGVPANVAKDVIVLEYGDPESLYTIRNHAHELAAVLVEPVQSRRLDLQPVEYLRELRKITQESNVALIFDEMVSGFRAHPAGVQGLWGIKADIATYGKIVGGGTPVGAVAGSAKYLDGIDGGMWQYGDASYPAAKRTYFGGTFCQHPFSMAACLATLRHMKSQGPALQANLNARTAAFAKRLNDFFEDEGLSIRVVYFASTFGFKFSGNIWGYREGEAYFSYSPVLVVEAPFEEGVLLETLILSTLNYDTAVASAASRMRAAAGNRFLAEMGGRRTNEQAAVAAARAAYGEEIAMVMTWAEAVAANVGLGLTGPNPLLGQA